MGNSVNILKTKTAKWTSMLFGLLCLLLIIVCISAAMGPSGVKPLQVFKILLNQLPFINLKPGWSSEEATIVLNLRVPRIFMAGLIGSALTLAGIAFQALLRNPLAEPYILGVSSGGSLGAIIAMTLGVSTFIGLPTLPIFAFFGALLTMLLVYNIARIEGRVPPHTLLLAGVIVNFFFSAIIMYLISIVGVEKAHSFQFWTMGDLSGLIPGGLMLVIIILIFASSVIIACYARNFNLLILGEESAAHLGVEVEKMKLIVFILASLITGAAVSACGMIGFVGLIIPHLGRMLLGADHRILIPASSLIGASFLIFADTLARTVQAPQEIPVGVITALCGGPFFIYLLRKQKKSFF
ncbi:iron ABC transporter permease [Candidatus Poribacteria bacterium]|nr:iron ABC transporter permease [Candidatus Poribacteria bacterium]